jgi:hypothetical protein
MLRTVCPCPARPPFGEAPAAPGMAEIIRYAGRTTVADATRKVPQQNIAPGTA